MDRKVCVVSVVIVLAVALALAGPAAGDMRAAFAGAGTAYSLDAAVRQLIPSARLEDGVAPELTVDLEVHRRVLAGTINDRGLDPNKQVCITTCPARGGPYTGHGCNPVYHCRAPP